MGLSDKNIWSLTVHDTNVFAGTSNGVYSLEDDTNLVELKPNLPPYIDVYALAVCDNYLYAGLYQNGGWRFSLSGVTNIENMKQLNPVKDNVVNFHQINGVTKFSYIIKTSCIVDFGIYTISGKLILPIISGWQNGKKYNIHIKNELLPSGIYIYKFKAGNYQENSRLVFMK